MISIFDHNNDNDDEYDNCVVNTVIKMITEFIFDDNDNDALMIKFDRSDH